jgi:hypothetical protein
MEADIWPRAHGVALMSVENAKIINVTVNDAVYDGIYLGSDPRRPAVNPQPKGSNKNTIRDSHVHTSGRNGINISDGSHNLIAYNELTGNTARGDRDTGCLIFRSAAVNIELHSDNAIDKASDNTILGNHIHHNVSVGVKVSAGLPEQAQRNKIIGNTIDQNQDHGLGTSHNQFLEIRGNYIANNRFVGIAAGFGVGHLQGANICGNMVIHNAHDAETGQCDKGIVVNGTESAGTLVKGNIVIDSCSGVDIEVRPESEATAMDNITQLDSSLTLSNFFNMSYRSCHTTPLQSGGREGHHRSIR